MHTAILLTGGLYHTPFAKTAHGLVRGPSRYRILGVVDEESAGDDAGRLLDGRERGIPIRSTLADFLDSGVKPTHCVLGVATVGGVIPERLRAHLLLAARSGLSLVSGLHQLLADDDQIVEQALATGAEVLDLRRPRPASELRFWTGEVLALGTPRIAVLGTDCALGKRTTCTLLRDLLREAGTSCEMIYTGQTGWLQGGEYGFLFDATLNDFVSGELEGAILRCVAEKAPDVILLEGQSALRNPSGPAGAEFLISAGAEGVILQHAPGRDFFEGFESIALRIPPLQEELELIRLLGCEVWALALNVPLDQRQEAEPVRERIERECGLPTVLPLEGGMSRLAAVVRERIGGGVSS